eukprot:TRINITY_DN9862_c0_g1_i2.p1 TRINITY_DN9862_c0_g1~~TRINITY_DN9862_c0_g1_i2.p1  ORF type:complete len:224 (+),score=31.33 TRINITY_DN9862_c0_g1_i2:80-673(+)
MSEVLYYHDKDSKAINETKNNVYSERSNYNQIEGSPFLFQDSLVIKKPTQDLDSQILDDSPFQFIESESERESEKKLTDVSKSIIGTTSNEIFHESPFTFIPSDISDTMSQFVNNYTLRKKRFLINPTPRPDVKARLSQQQEQQEQEQQQQQSQTQISTSNLQTNGSLSPPSCCKTGIFNDDYESCLLYTSPSPRDS